MANIKRLVLIFLGMIIGVAAVIFALSNKQMVVLTFLYVETEPVWVSALILASFALGMFFGLTVALGKAFSHRRQIKHLRLELDDMEGELIALRNQPLEEVGLMDNEMDEEETDR